MPPDFAAVLQNPAPVEIVDQALAAAVTKAERVARGNDVAAQNTELESFRHEVFAAAKRNVSLDGRSMAWRARAYGPWPRCCTRRWTSRKVIGSTAQ